MPDIFDFVFIKEGIDIFDSFRVPACMSRALGRAAQTEADAGNSPPDTGGVAAALEKGRRSPPLINAARCRACASRAPQMGAKRERDSAKHKEWSGTPKCFVMPDHPVRSIKGSCATALLMSRPPLLYQAELFKLRVDGNVNCN